MRGAPVKADPAAVRHRIIPADAGSTSQRDRCIKVKQDHPRGCGEHFQSVADTFLRAGSSPRMRGALADHGLQGPVHGIIPADAGSTSLMAWFTSRAKDHPRGCGEHSCLIFPFM